MIHRSEFFIIVRYLAATVFSVILVFSVSWIGHEILKFDENVAVGISLLTSLFINFMTVRNLVFQSSGSISHEALRFLLISMLFRLFDFLGFSLLFNIFSVQYLLALGIVLFSSLLLKFLSYRFWVFKNG